MSVYEVRGSREPLVLLGWLTTDLKPSGRTQSEPLPSDMSHPMSSAGVDLLPYPERTIEIYFRKFFCLFLPPYWVIDAREQPVRLWRLLPGFKENRR